MEGRSEWEVGAGDAGFVSAVDGGGEEEGGREEAVEGEIVDAMVLKRRSQHSKCAITEYLLLRDWRNKED